MRVTVKAYKAAILRAKKISNIFFQENFEDVTSPADRIKLFGCLIETENLRDTLEKKLLKRNKIRSSKW